MVTAMTNLQSLLQECLIATGHVECSTIIKRKDGSVKASSVGYEVGSCCSSNLASRFKHTKHTRIAQF